MSWLADRSRPRVVVSPHPRTSLRAVTRRIVERVHQSLRLRVDGTISFDRMERYASLFPAQARVDEEGFVRAVGEAMVRDGHDPMGLARALRRIFHDVGRSAAGPVAWNDVVAFMAPSRANEYHRAAEYVRVQGSGLRRHAHKDQLGVTMALTGDHVVTVGADAVVKLWTLAHGDHVASVSHDAQGVPSVRSRRRRSKIASLCAIPGVAILVAGMDRCVVEYDASTLKPLRRMVGVRDDTDGEAVVRHLQQSAETTPIGTVLLLRMPSLRHLAATRNLIVVYCGGGDGVVVYPYPRHARALEVRPLRVIPATDVELGTHFCHIPALRGFLSCARGMELLSEDNFSVRHVFAHPRTATRVAKPILAVVYSESQRQLFSVASERQVCVWSMSNEGPVQTVDLPTPARDVVCNDAEKHLLVLMEGSVVVVMNVVSYQTLQSLPLGEPLVELSRIMFSENRQQLVSVGGIVYSWRTKRAASGYDMSYQGHMENVLGAAYLRCSRRIATFDAKTVMLWDIDTGSRVAVMEAPSDASPICSIAVAASGLRLACLFTRGGITIFGTHGGHVLKEDVIRSLEAKTPTLDIFSIEESSQRHSTYAVVFSNAIAIVIDSYSKSEVDVRMWIRVDRSICRACSGVGSLIAHVIVADASGNLGLVSAATGMTRWLDLPEAPSTPLRTPSPSLGAPRGLRMRSVEGLLYLVAKDMVVAVDGTADITLWDIVRTQQPLGVHRTTSCNALLSLATTTSNTLLFAGDDVGGVVVMSLRNLPRCVRGVRYPAANIGACIIPVRTIAPLASAVLHLVRLQCLEGLLVVGAEVKWTYDDGTVVGELGDELHWPRWRHAFQEERGVVPEASLGVFMTEWTGESVEPPPPVGDESREEEEMPKLPPPTPVSRTPLVVRTAKSPERIGVILKSLPPLVKSSIKQPSSPSISPRPTSEHRSTQRRPTFEMRRRGVMNVRAVPQRPSALAQLYHQHQEPSDTSPRVRRARSHGTLDEPPSIAAARARNPFDWYRRAVSTLPLDDVRKLRDELLDVENRVASSLH